MTNTHFINLENFSLNNYKKVLENTELLPGRRLLKEKLSSRFKKLTQQGITNLHQLVQVLKSTERTKGLASETGIPIEYLIILKREINRYLPKPVNLADIPGIDPLLINKLKELGIKTTLQFFQFAETQKKRSKLSTELNLPVNSLNELAKLSDISRIWGVGPIFCRIFYETGTDTVEKISKATAEGLFRELNEVNKNKKYTKVKFTVKDVEQCIKAAQALPKTIED
jgi:hypothetical protein